jgi:lantibiotic modifying enzyme
MATDAVQISITFDALIEAVSKLNLADKQRLLDILEQQVAEAEEATWEQDPAVRAEMQASRDEIAAGDYVTLDD